MVCLIKLDLQAAWPEDLVEYMYVHHSQEWYASHIIEYQADRELLFLSGSIHMFETRRWAVIDAVASHVKNLPFSFSCMQHIMRERSIDAQ